MYPLASSPDPGTRLTCSRSRVVSLSRNAPNIDMSLCYTRLETVYHIPTPNYNLSWYPNLNKGNGMPLHLWAAQPTQALHWSDMNLSDALAASSRSMHECMRHRSQVSAPSLRVAG